MRKSIGGVDQRCMRSNLTLSGHWQGGVSPHYFKVEESRASTGRGVAIRLMVGALYRAVSLLNSSCALAPPNRQSVGAAWRCAAAASRLDSARGAAKMPVLGKECSINFRTNTYPNGVSINPTYIMISIRNADSAVPNWNLAKLFFDVSSNPSPPPADWFPRFDHFCFDRWKIM